METTFNNNNNTHTRRRRRRRRKKKSDFYKKMFEKGIQNRRERSRGSFASPLSPFFY
jgi:hypothetical protein